jgi:hypothetical protein
MKNLKGYAGITTISFSIVTMDYLFLLISPLDYINVQVPRIFFFIPILLGLTGYCLATWPLYLQKSPLQEYVFRLFLFVLISTAGIHYPKAYRDKNAEFLQVSEKLREFKIQQMENDLKFKIGLLSNSKGDFIYFKRIPGRREMIQEYIKKGFKTS